MLTALVISDLHGNFTDNQLPDIGPFPGIDAVLLAGDLTDGMHRMIPLLGERFAGIPVVMVGGNHDYVRVGKNADRAYTIEDQIERCRDLGAKHGVTFLENGVAYVHGVRVVGATLWTGFDLIPPIYTRKQCMYLAQNGYLPDDRLYGGRRGARMIDYTDVHMRSESGRSERFTPSRSIAMHKESRAFIEGVLATEHDGPTVVMTHHAPHPDSLMDPSIEGFRQFDYCYASDLSAILEADNAPEVWIHGHVHESRDYVAGNCRIVANPKGYPVPGGTENPHWNPRFTIEIERRLDLSAGMRI